MVCKLIDHCSGKTHVVSIARSLSCSRVKKTELLAALVAALSLGVSSHNGTEDMYDKIVELLATYPNRLLCASGCQAPMVAHCSSKLLLTTHWNAGKS